MSDFVELALEGIATRERAATIEAAARKLLEALPRCGLLHDDEEGVPFGCDKLATHAGVCDGRDGYACGPCRCKTCKPLKWADAARELEKALGGEVADESDADPCPVDEFDLRRWAERKDHDEDADVRATVAWLVRKVQR